MEEVLKVINAELIQLDENEIRTNNLILGGMLHDFLRELRTNSFFNSIFETCFFGGSFYDGLKVGKPNEFDIDFVFALPKNAKAKVIADDDNPGYVKVYLEQLDSLKKHSYPPSYDDIKKFVDARGYLSIPKIMSWFQGVVDKAKLKVIGRKYKVMPGKGPAITIHIEGTATFLDVDFVPCFKFGEDQWPSNCKRFASNRREFNEFFVVPKPKASRPDLFRLSFQEQERGIIHNFGNLKPAIRLIKLLRDVYNDKIIKSYYIKTLAMEAVEKSVINFRHRKLSDVFLELFDYYINALENGKIAYFWNNDLNLLEVGYNVFYTDLINRLRRFQLVFHSGDEKKIMNVFKMPESSNAQMCSVYPDDIDDFEIGPEETNDSTSWGKVSGASLVGIFAGLALGGLAAYALTKEEKKDNKKK